VAYIYLHDFLRSRRDYHRVENEVSPVKNGAAFLQDSRGRVRTQNNIFIIKE
jgi:hypothetical protein